MLLENVKIGPIDRVRFATRRFRSGFRSGLVTGLGRESEPEPELAAAPPVLFFVKVVLRIVAVHTHFEYPRCILRSSQKSV